MLLSAKLEEDSLRNILAPSTYLMKNEEKSPKGLKFNDCFTLEKCMSDLLHIRKSLQTFMGMISLVKNENENENENENYDENVHKKRSELHVVLQKINDMKFYCARTSDLVFRSLCGAQKEGGHALVSSRSRVLSLHGKAGRISLDIDHDNDRDDDDVGGRGREDSYLSMTFKDLLTVSKEIREVEKLAQKVTRIYDFHIIATEEDGVVGVEEDLRILFL